MNYLFIFTRVDVRCFDCFILVSFIGCEPYPYYDYTTVNFTTYDENIIASVTCDVGHRYPDGYVSKTITCINGAWEPGDLPPCLGTT